MKIHALKSCDTCKKAIKALTAAGHSLVVTDVRADGIEAASLQRWMADVGADALVNKRSTTWRGLDDQQRASAGTPGGATALILDNPTLLKRPVIETDGALYVGWSKEAQAALL